MHKLLLLGPGTALLASLISPGELNAQEAQPARSFAHSVTWDARLTPVPVAAAADPGDLQRELSARWRRPVWVLPVAGAVAGGFAGLLRHAQLCRNSECSGPPVLVPVGAVAGAVITAVVQKEVRRSRRNQPAQGAGS